MPTIHELVKKLVPEIDPQELDRVAQEMVSQTATRRESTQSPQLGVELEASTLSSLIAASDSELVPLSELVLFLVEARIRSIKENYQFLHDLIASLTRIERTSSNSLIIAAASNLLSWLEKERDI